MPYIPAFYGAKRPCHYKRFTVVIHLSSFVEDSENTEDHRALPPVRSEKLLQLFFLALYRSRPIVRPRFCTHFADILNSQLMYTVQLLMIKGGLTLILIISESMVSFADSPFKFPWLPPSRFLDPLVLVFSFVKLLHPVRPK